MASKSKTQNHLVSYSSEDEEEIESSKKKPDVNYDEVKMECSDDSDDNNKGSESEALFKSRDEYLAYKSQFKTGGEVRPMPKEQKDSGRLVPGESSEYGAFEPETKKKEIRSKSPDPIHKKKSHKEDDENQHRRNEKNERRRRRSSRSPAETQNKKRSRSPDQHTRKKSKSPNNNKKSRSPDFHKRKSRSPDYHKKKSRSPDYHKRKSRSSRSRSPEYHRRRDSDGYKKSSSSSSNFERISSRHHDRRDNRHQQGNNSKRDFENTRRRSSRSPTNKEAKDKYHQAKRNKKLVQMGLTTQAELDINQGFKKSDRSEVEAQYEKIKEITGVELPKYYNPTAINPLKFAEQIKKRQMLWSKKPNLGGDHENVTTKPEVQKESVPQPNSTPQAAVVQSFNKWEATNFGSNEANEKFRRLMGIKGNVPKPEVLADSAGSSSGAGNPAQRSATIFSDLDQQYEKARTITHTQRGLGLGFSGSLLAANQADPAATTTTTKKE